MTHKSVEEFSVRTVEFGGFIGALSALRLPFGKEARTQSVFSEQLDDPHEPALEIDNHDPYLTYTSGLLISPQDLQLLSTLVKRGDEHAKVLRGIVVWCEVNAPRYWHVEADTYRVGAERLSSESTMHIQGRGLSEDELVEMKENLTEGTMQRRMWMFSYQTLRRIYFQRKDHRLPQWRQFCGWIETLPFSKELILTQ